MSLGWWALFFVANDLLAGFVTYLLIRIFMGRALSVTELAALQTAVQQLTTDINALVAAGLISASALTPITAALGTLDTAIKGLLPAAPTA